MINENWTSGPWKSAGSLVYFANNAGGLCVDGTPNPNENASLIAAAPDLYEALKRMVDNAEQAELEQWFERECPTGDHEDVQAQWNGSCEYSEFCDEYESELSALAKARGGK